MARLPKLGEGDWGHVLNDYLKQTLGHDGKLVSGPTNPHTGGENTNLANSARAGILRLAGDLGRSAGSPKVTGLQGNPVSTTTPTNGQVLMWDEESGAWKPTDISGTGDGSSGGDAGHARAMAINSVRI